MNLVADEGVDKAIVDALRASGFSVKYFADVGAGATDKDVLALDEAQSLAASRNALNEISALRAADLSHHAPLETYTRPTRISSQN